jgi:hypothetical protein
MDMRPQLVILWFAAALAACRRRHDVVLRRARVDRRQPDQSHGSDDSAAQPNCHVFGVNIPYSTQARFGWSANQDNDCLTNDTGIGLGVNSYGAGYLCGSTLCSAGNINAGGNGLLWGR